MTVEICPVGVDPADDAHVLDIAFVNNMPDAALRQTEYQFARLLGAANPDIHIRLWPVSLPAVIRGPGAAEYLKARYRPVSQLWDIAPAAVIVTGCEPKAADLRDEPYWAQLVDVLTSARSRAVSVIASCLAAHAALLAFDDVPRRRLPAKLSGVYAQQTQHGHPLTHRVGDDVAMPQSRQNDVPTELLTARRYDVLMNSAESGWSVAAIEDGGHLRVLTQGHPEYDRDTLLLEFRRDVRRYVTGEQKHYPVAPAGYFTPAAAPVLDRLRVTATSGRADPATMFPVDELLSYVRSPWLAPAQRLYANWLAEVRRRAESRVPI